MKNLITAEKKNHIDALCREYKIYNYTINPDGSLDVDGNVNIIRRHSSFGKLALQFNKVTKDFVCNQNELTTLEGCPKEVGGSFSCGKNQLTSLEFSPSNVGGGYLCYDNQITSLKGCPTEINSNFTCGKNKLTSLEFGPVKVMGRYRCEENQLTTLLGAPQYVGEEFNCNGNNLTTLEYGPKEVIGKFNCALNQLTTLEHIPSKAQSIYYAGNPLGDEFFKFYLKFTYEQRDTFDRYFPYYDIWTNGIFHEENMKAFVLEIMVDGLR